MKFKQQVALKPGKYFINGKLKELTAEEIREYVDNTKKLLATGYGSTIQLEHPEATSAEAFPRDKKAAKLKNGVGWLEGIAVGDDGSMLLNLDVTDSKAAQQLKEGTIKFTSPHLARKPWTDGQGNVHEKFVAHVALTHKPRNIDQTAPELEEALQFSLADFVDGSNQFGDDGDDDDSDTVPEAEEAGSAAESTKPENPDLPKAEAESETADRQQWEAIVAYLDKLGLGLPADTNNENFKPRLLAALMTFDKAQQKVEQEAEAEKQKEEEVVEENPPMQFSLADVESGAVKNKPLALWIKHQHKVATEQLDAMVSEGRVSPAMRNRLVESTKDMQFSADGDALATFTLPQVVSILKDTATADNWNSGHITEEGHPEADAFFSIPEGVEVPPQKTEEFLASLEKRHPKMLVKAGR